MASLNTFCLKMHGIQGVAQKMGVLDGSGYKLVQVNYNVWTGQIEAKSVIMREGLWETVYPWVRIGAYHERKTMQEIALDVYEKVLGEDMYGCIE